MKNISHDAGDSLRPEYRRSDFGDMVQGKYAASQVEFVVLVRLLLTCISEDEGLKFVHHCESSNCAGRRHGDWTYELGHANQITLRYWLSEVRSLEEPIANSPCVTNAEEQSALQDLLLNRVRALKARVETSEK